MEADLSAEVESMYQFLSQSRQRIRQIVGTGKEKLGSYRNSDLKKLLRLLDDILSLTITDVVTSKRSKIDTLETSSIETDVKEELCSEEEIDFFEPFYPPALGIIIQPDNKLHPGGDNEHDSESMTCDDEERTNNKFRRTRGNRNIHTARNKLGRSHPRNVNCDDSEDINCGSSEVKKVNPARKRSDLHLVVDRLSEKDLAKWEIEEQNPDDGQEDGDDDDDYIPPNSSPSTDEEQFVSSPRSEKSRAKTSAKKRSKFTTITTKPQDFPHPCPDCGIVIKTPNILLAHRKQLHSGPTPRLRTAPIYPCSYCPLKFGSKNSLLSHHTTNHASIPTSFIDPSAEFAAIDPTTGKTRYRCPDCPVTSSNPANFKNHRKIHTGEKPFSCAECGASFRVKNALERHVEGRHATKEKEFLCEQCPKSFRFRFTLVAHQKLMHPPDEGTKVTWLCSQCPKEFNLKRNLTTHVMTTHEQLRRFKCPLCDKAFKQKPHLRYHEKTHQNPTSKKRGLNRIK